MGYVQRMGTRKYSHMIRTTQLAMDSLGEIDVQKFDYFYFQKINFINIDVEGFEFDVIKGAKELLTFQSPIIL